jgi:hypothetical protein
VTFDLIWADANRRDAEWEPPHHAVFNGMMWEAILSEMHIQGAAIYDEPAAPPRPPLTTRFLRTLGLRKPDPGPEPLTLGESEPVLPLNLWGTQYNMGTLVTAAECQALLKQLSPEPTQQSDRVWWPEQWHRFYAYLQSAVDHDGFQVY